MKKNINLTIASIGCFILVAFFAFNITSSINLSESNLSLLSLKSAFASGSENGGDSGGGETGGEGTDDPNAIFKKREVFSVTCTASTYTKTVYYDIIGNVVGSVKYDLNGAKLEGELMAQGTYHYSVEEVGGLESSVRNGWNCPAALIGACSPCPNPCVGC
jgi:hypothetical protein